MTHWPLLLLFQFLLCDEQPVNDSIVTVTAREVKVDRGENAVMHIYVTVKNGFHIQAHKVNDEFIIPTTLDINTGEIVKMEQQIFPPAKKFRLEGTADYLLVYDGSFEISVPCRAGEKIQKGKYILSAKLHYQACNNKTCFFPKTVNFSISVKVT